MENFVLKPYQRLLRMFNLDKKEIYHIYFYSMFIGLTNLALPLGIQSIINLVQLGTVSASWINHCYSLFIPKKVSGDVSSPHLVSNKAREFQS